MNGLRVAVSLLTRIPVRADLAREAALAGALVWFPVVGAMVGLVVAGVYAAALAALPGPLAATAAISAGIVVTGAFHEDGLADTADALGGATGAQDALAILKDPRLGTYGVLAVVLALLLRVLSVAVLSAAAAFAVLPAAHALSRAAAIGLAAVLPAAAPSGLGTSYASHVTRAGVVATLAVALALAGVALGAWALPVALAALPGPAAVAYLAARKIGGVTGDVLGAAEQTAEIGALLAAAALVYGGTADLVWWS